MLLDAVPAMIFFKDSENRFVRVNRAYAEAVGRPKTEIVGKSVGDFLPDPKMATTYWEDDRDVIETGQPKRNITAAHITDAKRWLRTEKIPYRSEDGSIIGVAGLSVDISDMKRTEIELARRVRQQKAIADLGQMALSGVGCSRLFDEAAALVSRTLEVEYCHILEYRTREDKCIPRAGVGPDEQFCCHMPCETGEKARNGCPMRLRDPIVIGNLQDEQHLRESLPLLEKLGVVSGLRVVIGTANKPFGVLGAYATRQQHFSSSDIDFLQGFANMLALAVEQEQAGRAIRESTRQLRHLSSKLIEAQEEERHRIFQALHDELGQSLALLKLQIRAVQMKMEPKQLAIRANCNQMLTYLSGVIENVRRLCHDLTPAALEDLGLNAALRWLFEDFTRHFDFQFAADLDNVDHIFRRDAQLLIYRIFQEALTNVHKHAGASQVRATLQRRPDEILCEVVDNGKGMDPDRLFQRQSPGDGLGLAAMKERALMLGGHFDIETRPGCGSCIRVTIPIDRDFE